MAQRRGDGVDDQRNGGVVVARRERIGLPPHRSGTWRDLHLTASDLLINVGAGGSPHQAGWGGRALPSAFNRRPFDAVKGQGDVVRVASGVAQQVIPGAVLRRVVAQVDAGIDVLPPRPPGSWSRPLPVGHQERSWRFPDAHGGLHATRGEAPTGRISQACPRCRQVRSPHRQATLDLLFRMPSRWRCATLAGSNMEMTMPSGVATALSVGKIEAGSARDRTDRCSPRIRAAARGGGAARPVRGRAHGPRTDRGPVWGRSSGQRLHSLSHLRSRVMCSMTNGW